MKLIDLIPVYMQTVLKQNDPQRYEASFPLLFAHYYTYFASPGAYLFRDEEEILRRRELIGQHLSLLSQKYEEQGFQLDELQVVLFVGQGTSNGHALPLENQWLVWLPLEAYPSPLAMDVFVTHEIAHALHYRRQPDFFFSNEEERRQVFRQLVTEGMATFFSKQILGIRDEQALWADYLPHKTILRWSRQCRHRERELFRYVAQRLEESDLSLFAYSDSEDILENRGGYYVGLKIIEACAQDQNLSLQDLLEISKVDFFAIALETLKQ